MWHHDAKFYIVFFFRYDKFRKSDKKAKNGETEENPTEATDAVNDKNNTEINATT